MKISIIGAGYVGLVQGSCLADFGFNVVCIEKDTNKLRKLQLGRVPFYEPGLDRILKKNILREYSKLKKFSSEELINNRIEKYNKIGNWIEQ